MNYTLKNVSENVEEWSGKDPVRPELDAEFKTASGREVYGLMDEEGSFKAFLCLAYTDNVPTNISELELFVSYPSYIAVPYSVWSYQKGAGKEIVRQVALLMKDNPNVTRLITLSPLTDMARKFHLRNNAIELSVNKETVNFEYLIGE
jgi:hypothetical protein